MNRTIVTERDVERIEQVQRLKMGDVGAVAPPPSPDNYLGRLLKYIPPDVIAAFIFLEGTLAGAAAPHHDALAWAVFVIVLVATPFYLWRLGNVRKPIQIILSTIAFIIWAIAYQGPPFASLNIPTVYATLLMGLYTFLIPIFQPN